MVRLKAQLPVAATKFWQTLPHEYVRGTLEELCSFSGQLELDFGDDVIVQPRFRVLKTREKYGLDSEMRS